MSGATQVANRGEEKQSGGYQPKVVFGKGKGVVVISGRSSPPNVMRLFSPSQVLAIIEHRPDEHCISDLLLWLLRQEEVTKVVALSATKSDRQDADLDNLNMFFDLKSKLRQSGLGVACCKNGRSFVILTHCSNGHRLTIEELELIRRRVYFEKHDSRPAAQKCVELLSLQVRKEMIERRQIEDRAQAYQGSEPRLVKDYSSYQVLNTSKGLSVFRVSYHSSSNYPLAVESGPLLPYFSSLSELKNEIARLASAAAKPPVDISRIPNKQSA